MMLERMHLEIFEALARWGSLTRAAEELNLTQSALTHSVRKLEALIGTQLWEKEGRKLRLTQSGEYLRDAARRLLPQIRETEEVLHGYGSGRNGRLRIGVECHPCYEYLVGLIDGFLHNWESVDIDVTRQFQFGGAEALMDHNVDLVVSPDLLPGDGLHYQDILDFELMLLVPSGHRLASRPFAEPDDLAAETLFSYPIGRERLDVFTGFLVPAGRLPRKHVEVEATEVMMQLVAAGRGVSTFPAWLIEKYRNDFPVEGVRLGRGGIQKKLYIVIRSEDRNVPYIRDFVERARSARSSDAAASSRRVP